MTHSRNRLASPILLAPIIAGLLAILALAVPANAQGPDPTALHDALHLTPVQEEAWRTYRIAMTPDPGAQARHTSAQMMMATLPTPRRIDLIEAEMASDLDVMRRQGQAVKTFYATLTPDQQRIFDQQTLPQSEPMSDPSAGGAPPPPAR